MQRQVIHEHLWRFLFLVGACVFMLTWSKGVTPAGEQSRAIVDESGDLSVAFARACLDLAEADYAAAVAQNQLAKNAVADFDVARLQMQVEAARQNLADVQRGADYGRSIARHIELQAKLAELDLTTMKKLAATGAVQIADVQLDRLRRYAEVCKLRAELARNQTSPLSVMDHLHWETHRLSEEILLLARRVERLEEVALR